MKKKATQECDHKSEQQTTKPQELQFEMKSAKKNYIMRTHMFNNRNFSSIFPAGWLVADWYFNQNIAIWIYIYMNI